ELEFYRVALPVYRLQRRGVPEQEMGEAAGRSQPEGRDVRFTLAWCFALKPGSYGRLDGGRGESVVDECAQVLQRSEGGLAPAVHGDEAFLVHANAAGRTGSGNLDLGRIVMQRKVDRHLSPQRKVAQHAAQ